MEATTLNLLLQIPLAGVVVVVVVLFLRHLEKVTDNFVKAQADQAIITATVQKEQLATFMNAIKDQREDNMKSLATISENMSSLATLITTSLAEMRATTKPNKRARKEV